MMKKNITTISGGSEKGLSTTQVGRIMGRDHSTVCYALQSIEGRMAADPSFAEAVERIMDK